MSEHRRRSSNPGGGEQPPGRGAPDGHPYAYGSPPEGAPRYDRPRPAARQTAQQPRMTRAEMRKQSGKAGRGKQTSTAASGQIGRADGGKGGSGGPGKKRFIDYPRFGKQGVWRWMPSWKQILTAVLVFFGSCVAAIGIAYANTDVPDPKAVVKDQNNIYYWQDGTEMTRQGSTNRQIVQLGEISPNARKAVIAAENETFETDSGIDPKGIARAIYNMATGGQTQGGSTITQQYVKNTYLSQEQTLSRKVDELFITLKVNQEKSKDEILTDYLNTSWFGRNATGIQAAAQAYYGVDAKNLDVCQSAMLAGLLKGAALYDPTIAANKPRMVERWNWILGRMVITKAITPEEKAKCATFPEPIPKKAAANMNGEISYLVDTANKYVLGKDPKLTQAILDRGGFQIYTTFDKGKVDALKKAVDDVKSETLNAQKRPTTDTFVQVGAASVVPNDGAIVAIYGGDGVENKHYTNNADGFGVPVGSTFKPFVLATAMQTGVLTKKGPDGGPAKISPDSRYLADDMAQIYRADGSPAMENGKPYHQKNDSTGDKGYVTLKTAMQYSYNVPFVQLGQDVGGNNVKDMLIKLGLVKQDQKPDPLAPPSTLTFPLGTSTPSAIRMASAYSVFAAQGQQTDPYSVLKLVQDGVQQPNFDKPKARTALDQAVANSITDVLQNVAENGTGKKTNELGRPVAGKTGTTDAGTSAWWVGYTPQLATSVGMWREEPGKPGLLSLDGTAGHPSVHGGDFPTDIFTRYMKVALNGQEKLDFPTAQPVGETVNSSGAPSTDSPSPSPSDSPSTASAPASLPPVTTPSPSASRSASPSSSPSASSTCLLGLCDSPPPVPSPSPSRTRPGPPSSPPASPSSTGPGLSGNSPG
ncbi:transglycosylase domain-containing protein [Kitasatospora sp. McL0602]|uniref:transglycosylase domain-containing protein n=1 Tax=Kitasatospora sp. McL0602 TaxID=3439530 RepID=UPI003F8CACEA